MVRMVLWPNGKASDFGNEVNTTSEDCGFESYWDRVLLLCSRYLFVSFLILKLLDVLMHDFERSVFFESL